MAILPCKMAEFTKLLRSCFQQSGFLLKRMPLQNKTATPLSLGGWAYDITHYIGRACSQTAARNMRGVIEENRRGVKMKDIAVQEGR